MEKFSLSLSLLDCAHTLPPLPCPMSCSVVLSSMLWKCGQNQQLLSFMRSDIHLTNFHIICCTIHTFLMCRSVHSATANSLATPCSLHCVWNPTGWSTRRGGSPDWFLAWFTWWWIPFWWGGWSCWPRLLSFWPKQSRWSSFGCRGRVGIQTAR